MAGVRSMLGRVQRLEAARGGADEDAAHAAFVAEAEAGMAAGRLDRTDVPVVLACLATWRAHYGVLLGPQRVRGR